MIVRRGIQVKTLDDWLPQLPFQGEIAGAYILSSEARLGSEMRQQQTLALLQKLDLWHPGLGGYVDLQESAKEQGPGIGLGRGRPRDT